MTPAVALRTWIAVVGSTIGTFMAIINVQIVNASLGDIQGAIGAGIDDGGWISTAYLVAEIEVDSFPGVTLKGHVDSVSPASGLEFALLPADNATGNFTKIVQRVPVKIVLDDRALAGRLRPGMSVEATVDTRARH